MVITIPPKLTMVPYCDINEAISQSSQCNSHDPKISFKCGALFCGVKPKKT